MTKAEEKQPHRPAGPAAASLARHHRRRARHARAGADRPAFRLRGLPDSDRLDGAHVARPAPRPQVPELRTGVPGGCEPGDQRVRRHLPELQLRIPAVESPEHVLHLLPGVAACSVRQRGQPRDREQIHVGLPGGWAGQALLPQRLAARVLAAETLGCDRVSLSGRQSALPDLRRRAKQCADRSGPEMPGVRLDGCGDHRGQREELHQAADRPARRDDPDPSWRHLRERQACGQAARRAGCAVAVRVRQRLRPEGAGRLPRRRHGSPKKAP